jgi:hypothetical protein
MREEAVNVKRQQRRSRGESRATGECIRSKRDAAAGVLFAAWCGARDAGFVAEEAAAGMGQAGEQASGHAEAVSLVFGRLLDHTLPLRYPRILRLSYSHANNGARI